MHYLLYDIMLLNRQRFMYMPQILCIQLAQKDGNVLQTRLLYAMCRCCNDIVRYQDTATLKLRYAYMRLPRVFGEIRRPPTDDALL